MNAVAQAYDAESEREWNRLVKDPFHSLEFLVTRHYLLKYLPPHGRVLDAGGGPGRYSLELCRAGYQVTLLDISPGLLALAKGRFQLEPASVQTRLLEFVQGDIRDLGRFAANSFDAVLCLGGPLTHIPDQAERRQALSELVRVAKPGAVVFVSVMGYLAVLRTTMTRLSDYMLDAEWQTLVQKGTVPIGNAGMVWHFFRADELRQEAERCGLTTLEMAGCEGLSAGLSEATNTLGQDETKWKQWVDLVVQTSAEPGVADMADHILYVGRASKA